MRRSQPGGSNRVGRLAVAHLRLARMYDELAKLRMQWGDTERARAYARRADRHLTEARSTPRGNGRE
jgi:hypothetical protein